MGELKTYKSINNKICTTPFGEFTREDGSKYIVTPTYLPITRLSNNFISITNYKYATSVYDGAVNPLYGELPYNFAHDANAGSYSQNQSLLIKMSSLKQKGFVPYSICIEVRQWSNQGTVQTFIDIGSNRVVNESFHSDVGKNGRVTRVLLYKWSIFDNYYTPTYQQDHGRRGYGNPPWLNNYIADKNNLNDIRITTGAHWGDRGGWDNINVLVYFGIVSDLVDTTGVYYAQPSYY